MRRRKRSSQVRGVYLKPEDLRDTDSVFRSLKYIDDNYEEVEVNKALETQRQLLKKIRRKVDVYNEGIMDRSLTDHCEAELAKLDALRAQHSVIVAELEADYARTRRDIQQQLSVLKAELAKLDAEDVNKKTGV